MTTTRIRRLRGVCVGAGLAVAAAVLPAAPASAGSTASSIAALRQATAAFHNLSVATDADGAAYASFLGCFDLPGVGGMGQHFVHGIDANLDPLDPEALVYEPTDSGYKLVAVEFIVPMALWSGQDPPSLYGQSFHAVPSLGVWALHVWLWRPNPDGMFADYNPNVALCP
jgi:hypothetical protein